ncbi:MAG: hypothetical protein K5879_03465, partial [Lachnospiraceae bacterium]|nr:hypothetical protein [Lachnospiraceae bacterium]
SKKVFNSLPPYKNFVYSPSSLLSNPSSISSIVRIGVNNSSSISLIWDSRSTIGTILFILVDIIEFPEISTGFAPSKGNIFFLSFFSLLSFFMGIWEFPFCECLFTIKSAHIHHLPISIVLESEIPFSGICKPTMNPLFSKVT